jgi:hypothetical protein
MGKLTEGQKELINHALTMRQNVIETGDHTLSANDIANMGKDAPHFGDGIGIRALSRDQMQLILDIDALKILVMSL